MEIVQKTTEELEQMKQELLLRHRELVDMALEYSICQHTADQATRAFRFYHNIRIATRS